MPSSSLHSSSFPGKQQGIGLLEVLIAVVVLAVGLLGIAALQAITLKNSGGSAERTQAVIQTYSLLDLLRANKPTVATFNTGGTFACGSYTPTTAGGTPGTPNATLSGWLAGLQAAIGPSACAKVDCNTTNPAQIDCTITTRWDASRSTGGRIVRAGETVASGQENLQTLETKTRL